MRRFVLLFGLVVLLQGCRATTTSTEPDQAEIAELSATAPTGLTEVTTYTLVPTPQPESPQPTQTALPTDTLTPRPEPATQTPLPTDEIIKTATPQPTPTATASMTPTPAVTRSPESDNSLLTAPLATAAGCINRIPPAEDLLVIVTKRYGLSQAYIPPDLVPLDQHFDLRVTKGYPTLVREVILQPLITMVSDMQAAGLDPYIISGYRDFYTQSLAYDKWSRTYPDRADILSARPGHSEHQLGTTVDFGSYALNQYLEEDEQNLEFHTYFYKTAEGEWLKQNAHRYGFSLSYPREAQGITGFYYEPWHYRYVGVEMATQLFQMGTTLTEQQLLTLGEPC